MGTGDILFGKTRSGVLALLLGRPDEKFYTREILRRLDLGQGAVQRELQTLEAVGLITRTRLGSQIFYQANRQSPIFPEMKSLVDKTIGIFDLLRESLRELSSQIKIAFIFGSVARREEHAGSDVDLMVIGNASLESVLEALEKAERTVQRQVNPTVYSPAEFKQKIAIGNHFLSSVLKGQKEFLIGTEDELRKMGRKRLA